MKQYRVLFDSLEWQSGIHGAKFKAFRSGAKQLRLLEFTSEFVEPDWCEKGHIGFVVQGELEIDFHGQLVRYPEGSGIFIPSGAENGHKARSITPFVLLFLVEDI
ncbi:MAG: phosrestin [Gallionellales bacterium CG_4_10_14_3_um_filter_54_96]|nr:MAG: phosrestin [Gallionellales bacterium CG_4_10_14_3_um_filter_54_96]